MAMVNTIVDVRENAMAIVNALVNAIVGVRVNAMVLNACVRKYNSGWESECDGDGKCDSGCERERDGDGKRDSERAGKRDIYCKIFVSFFQSSVPVLVTTYIISYIFFMESKSSDIFYLRTYIRTSVRTVG